MGISAWAFRRHPHSQRLPGAKQSTLEMAAAAFPFVFFGSFVVLVVVTLTVRPTTKYTAWPPFATQVSMDKDVRRTYGFAHKTKIRNVVAQASCRSESSPVDPAGTSAGRRTVVQRTGRQGVFKTYESDRGS